MAGRKRRGRGEGSIYRRKDGRYVGQYAANGKRRYVYGATRAEVSKRLTAAIAERDRGIVFDSENLSLADYLDMWLDSIRGTVRESTWVRHEINVRVHLKPALPCKLDKLHELQVQSLYRRKLDEGQSPASVRKIHATLTKALKQAVRWRLVPMNACESAALPRLDTEEIKPLDTAQIGRLLRAAENTQLHALWVLMATTGVRIGEALALGWDDVDLDARRLRVSKTLYRGVVGQPKTTNGRRTIRLTRLAADALKRHPRRGDFVFCTGSGGPINVNNLRYRDWKRLLDRSGLPATTRMHDLRHSAATLLLSRGVPVKVVSEMWGHHDVAFTLRVYGHVLPDMQDGAADTMDEALNGTVRAQGQDQGAGRGAFAPTEPLRRPA